MQMNDYQKAALTTAIYKDLNTQLVCTVLGLNGEAGEVAEKVKKLIRDKDSKIEPTDRLEIQKELGDVLWYLSVLARTLGIDLEDVALMNLEKLKSRAERGALKGSGDDR